MRDRARARYAAPGTSSRPPGRPSDSARIDAHFDGYNGLPFDRSQREALLRLILLHRYSNPKAQIAVPGWQAAPDFTTLAALVWP